MNPPWPFLSADEVLRINEAIVGPNRLRDRALLESAVSRPASSAFGQDVYPTVHDQAAALLHAIARNHAFVDGNKRTALVACVVFYGRCGYRMTIGQDEFADLVLEVAQDTYSVGALAGSLREHVEALPPPDDE